ncbi:MAG TPA: zf-TFIIB domain-containing protein, partial [Dehalococcoidia bacterium]|nr:zf-TFIIB domain-containing protein [Dehalococcoidia bacterium]
YYGESTITVDICQACEGIWLDKDEYEEIVAYLEHMVNTQSIGDYLNDVREEFVELFTGTEGGIGELRDLDKVLYLLELRFVVEHPRIATLLRKLPG